MTAWDALVLVGSALVLTTGLLAAVHLGCAEPVPDSLTLAAAAGLALIALAPLAGAGWPG